jgi:hypothetical protein
MLVTVRVKDRTLLCPSLQGKVCVPVVVLSRSRQSRVTVTEPWLLPPYICGWVRETHTPRATLKVTDMFWASR